MPRRTRRLLLPVAALALLAGLTACGDSSDSKDASTDSSSASGDASSAAPTSAADVKALDSIKVTGKFGKKPKVTFGDGDLQIENLASKTLIEGDGDKLAAGDSAFAQFWVGNGASKKEVYSTYDQQPQALSLSDPLIPALLNSLVGQTVGSRVLIVSSPAQAFGDQGNPQLGIGNADSVVFVVDLMSALPSGPSGTDRTPAPWAPKVVMTDEDVPTSLDFTDTPQPSGKLQRTTLIQGNGAVTKKGDHVYVNYLGQVYGADKPFDESYSRGTPFDFDLGTGGQPGGPIVGWDRMLTGVKVGSRVIVEIPPKYGYGSDGNSGAGIKGTDTIYFVVDVLAAT
jgi:FKBP-type peptidyl-prolyl cis-trans isomerase